MARPKGVIQKRDESKYWLPEGVSLSDANGISDFRKETKLIFVDAKFGEFISTFKAIQGANASTHPKAVLERRQNTNLERYGVINAGSVTRDKAVKTMDERYGKDRAALVEKIKKTNLERYGTEFASSTQEFKDRVKATLKEKYGVDNPMKLDSVKEKLVKTNLERYGVRNAGASEQSRLKAIATMTTNDSRLASKMETEVKEFVESLGLQTKKSFVGGAKPFEVDILIPEANVGIEVNGSYYHSELFRKDTKYHLHKTEQFKKQKGGKLIQIFDYEWDNRKDQVKSFLRSALKKNSINLSGRKCVAKEITKNEARDFLNKYHILGSAKIYVAYGLFYKDELVQVLTVSLHHRNSRQFVLSRFCGKTDVSVSGGLSKLTKLALNDFKELITWIDRRFSDAEGWIALGWEVTKVLPPDYMYFDSKKSKIVSKQSRKKSIVGTPEEMTEHEHALRDKLYRIYDCGKFTLSIKRS